jgi:quinol monooxygenase YgiN
MLIRSIHFAFAAEDANRVASIFEELQDLSRREPGVVGFDLGRSKDKPNVFALWEQYRDDAALKSHVESEHHKRPRVRRIGALRPLGQGASGNCQYRLRLRPALRFMRFAKKMVANLMEPVCGERAQRPFVVADEPGS